MGIKNFHQKRNRHPALLVNDTEVEVVGDFVDFGNPSKVDVLDGQGERLYIGHVPSVEVRLTVTTPTAVNYAIKHTTDPGGTLRQLAADNAAGEVDGNASEVVWSGPMPPGWIALDVGGKTNVEVDIAAAAHPLGLERLVDGPKAHEFSVSGLADGDTHTETIDISGYDEFHLLGTNASGDYSVDIEFLSRDETIVYRTKTDLISNTSGGGSDQATDVRAKSDRINVKVTNDDGGGADFDGDFCLKGNG